MDATIGQGKHCSGTMTRYRYVTPHRTGKWYPDLATAQRHAAAIGAGFRDTRTGAFIAYVGTLLEKAEAERLDPA